MVLSGGICQISSACAMSEPLSFTVLTDTLTALPLAEQLPPQEARQGLGAPGRQQRRLGASCAGARFFRIALHAVRFPCKTAGLKRCDSVQMSTGGKDFA